MITDKLHVQFSPQQQAEILKRVRQNLMQRYDEELASQEAKLKSLKESIAYLSNG